MTSLTATGGGSDHGSALAGTGTLIRFILRRDRVRVPVWIAAIVGFCLMSVASFPGIYASAADRQARAELMQNPAAIIFTGPGYGLDNYTFGAMTANEMFGFMAIVVALMNILLVVRHTRAEEETGRSELVRAAIVGRHAPGTATLVVVGGVNIAIGGLLTLGLPASLSDLSLVGSLAFGAGMTAVGLFFAAAATVAAQVTEHTRGAIGLGCAALGVTYALRIAGDLGSESRTLSWLSPFGWAQSTRAYVDERWWPLLMSLGVTAVLVGAAFVLNTRRDVGAGLVHQRPGPATASAMLAGPLGLALRLQRAGFIAWSVALVAFGLAYGTMGSEVENFVAENEAIAAFLAGAGDSNVVDSFFATFLQLMAMLVAGFAISSALRMRGEETAGRAEPVLAAAVPRWRWAAGHLTVAAAGCAVILALMGLAFGVTASISTRDASMLPALVGASLAYVPVLWLIIGLTVALFGLVPRAVSLVWAVLAYVVTVGMLGGLLRFPDWTYDLSPFAHAPQLPADDLAIMPLVLLTAVAVGMTAIGLAALRRRDLHTT